LPELTRRGSGLAGRSGRLRQHEERSPALQGGDRQIAEEKDERRADIKEEELHDYLLRHLPDISLVSGGRIVGFPARERAAEIRMDPASSIRGIRAKQVATAEPPGKT
jgi:hypothetical protein